MMANEVMFICIVAIISQNEKTGRKLISDLLLIQFLNYLFPLERLEPSKEIQSRPDKDSTDDRGLVVSNPLGLLSLLNLSSQCVLRLALLNQRREGGGRGSIFITIRNKTEIFICRFFFFFCKLVRNIDTN